MRKHIARGLALVLSVVSLGAAQRPTSSELVKTQGNAKQTAAAVATNPKDQHGSKPYQVGTASWYGSYFQGKTTASGEPYDMYDMTAAHMQLPLGTLVKVTNLRNGRAVVLRINDRGPVVDGRIIDVSYNAARALDFKARGLQRVRLDVVKPELIATLR
jgi:peptidoglycan lytic transglycosylase